MIMTGRRICKSGVSFSNNSHFSGESREKVYIVDAQAITIHSFNNLHYQYTIAFVDIRSTILNPFTADPVKALHFVILV